MRLLMKSLMENISVILANIDGYEDFYKVGEKDWIGELRNHAYGFLKDISNNK